MNISQKIDKDIELNGKEFYYYKPIFTDKKQDYKYRNENNLFVNYGGYTIEKIYADLRILQHLRKVKDGYILPNLSKREIRLLRMLFAMKRQNRRQAI